MQKKLESGYTVETSLCDLLPLVRVYDGLGVQVAMRKGFPDEATALLVGEAMAQAHFDGCIYGRERLASRVMELMHKYEP